MNKSIRLYWGENYSQKPKIVIRAIQKAVNDSISSIHLYPGVLYQEVIDLIASTHKLQQNQIILGHGIEGLIHLISTIFLVNGKTGGMFDPSFFCYNNNLDRVDSVRYPCHYDKKVNIDKFITTIKNTSVFFLASPNTATGNYLLSKNEIEEVLQSYNGLFVVDECYFGLGKESVINLINKYDNLIVLRGVTKVMGFAGIRLGFAISNKTIIEKLKYNFTDIEYDPINRFSLNVFKYTYPHFELLANNTNEFFIKFYEFLIKKFPKDKFIKTYTTFYFMNIKRYNIKPYKIINYMNNNGYLFSDKTLLDDSSIHFPEFIELTPPPEKLWLDFATKLKKAFNN